MQQKPTENGTEGNLYFSCLFALDKPVMVLTRASIRLSKLISLEKKVGRQKFRELRWISSIDRCFEWPFISIAVWKTKPK
jgi:hypothetical protein